MDIDAITRSASTPPPTARRNDAGRHLLRCLDDRLGQRVVAEVTQFPNYVEEARKRRLLYALVLDPAYRTLEREIADLKSRISKGRVTD